MPGGPTLGDQYAVRAEAGRAADHGAEVARVGDRVERDDRAAARRSRAARSSRSSGWAYSYAGIRAASPWCTAPAVIRSSSSLVTSSRLMPLLGGELERLAQPAVALGALGDVDAGDRHAGPQRLDDGVAAGDPLGVALPVRRLRSRPRRRAPPWSAACRPCGWGGPWPWASGPLPSRPRLTRPPEPAVGLLAGLVDRALALRVAWPCQLLFDGPLRSGRGVLDLDAGGLDPVADRVGGGEVLGRPGLGALLEQPGDQDVDGVLQLLVGAAGLLPRPGRRGPARARRASPAPRPRCRGARRRPVGQQLVALADGVVDDRHRGRRAEVVVHRGDERRRGRVPSAGRSPQQLGGAVEEALDPAEPGRRLVERLVAELDVRAVVRGDHVEPQLDPAHPLEHRRDQQRVAERLAHLLAGGGDPRVVHPVRRERVPGRARLGLLVLVVREAQVDAAAVDVEGRRRGTCPPSPSTRCASPGGPDPRATARPRSPARTPSSSPSRARSRAGRACRAGRRRSAASMSSIFWCVSSPYAGHDRTSK